MQKWLDDHIRAARQGIRFITPDYKEIFRIPDGDKVRITFADGEAADYVCRYIDPYHVEVGDHLWHICQVAEKMEEIGAKIVPLRSSLPELCYSVNKTTGEIIVLKKGETGFYKTDIPSSGREESQEIADEQNQKLGVSKAQAAAMYTGSLFGFETPGADPKNYGADGKPIKNERKEKGDER